MLEAVLEILRSVFYLDAVKISISGANGWLGRSAVAAFSQVFPTNWQTLILPLSRKPAQIILNDSIGYETKSAQDFSNLAIDLHVPLAFLTREKFFEIGNDQYFKQNLKIINEDIQFALKNQSERILLISSGVVLKPSKKQMSDLSYLRYAELKKIQEKMYINYFGKSNVSICYVFSGTSIDMNRNSEYVFMQLVKRAMFDEEIYIESKSSVIRRYMDFRQMFQVLFNQLRNQKQLMLSSYGEKIEVEELANLIVKKLGSKSKISRSFKFNELDDSYYSEDNTIYNLMRKFSMNYATLENQIENIIKVVK